MNENNYNPENIYSKKFRDKDNISDIISNYVITPLCILKYILLLCKETTDNAIFDALKNSNENNATLIDCIILSTRVKLCDIKLFSRLCSVKCICGNNIKFKKLYKRLLNLLDEDNNYINNISFISNFSQLIKSSNVYDNNLYECIKKISNKNIYVNGVINLIVQSSLFTPKYKDIINNYANTQVKTIRNVCTRVNNIINEHISQCSLIESDIYISNNTYVNNIPSIVDNNFGCIVSLTNDDILLTNKNKNLKIIHYNFSITDDATYDFYDKTKNVINEILKIVGTTKILIHCNRGLSLSAIFTALLIQYKNNIKFNKALKIIKNKRNSINPNIDILNQIKNKK
jgi:hypothetical protein